MNKPVADRLAEKGTRLPPSDLPVGCLVWTGSILRTGYAQICISSKRRLVHVVAYELANGPVPNGLDVDHLCRVRACFEPTHLEAVTRQVNVLRGQGVAAINARKEACPQGHPYDETNTYVWHPEQEAYRLCRTCRRQRAG